jgi:co-chaperonin GroES (HSP10)
MLKATGYHVLVEPMGVVKKSGLSELDKLGFEVQHEDEKLSKYAVQFGTIISIGPTAWESFGPNFTGKPWAKVGDKVFFPRYSAATVQDPENGREFALLVDNDIQLIVEEGENLKFEMKEYKFHPDRGEAA